MQHHLGTWASVGPANGPGFHTDEASSAFPVIKTLVAPATAQAIAGIDHIARSNPPDESKADETIGFAKLIPIARLVTGQWGPLLLGGREKDAQGRTADQRLAETIGSVRANPRRLPMYRANPAEDVRSGSWTDEPFWRRMTELREVLLSTETQSREIYRKNGVTNPDKMGWANALEQCRGDVEWVLTNRAKALAGTLRVVERDASDRVQSVMGVNPSTDARLFPRRIRARANPDGGMGRTAEQIDRRPWGILAADGNQKLPFVAYSTLPMASCPGAGGCQVVLVDNRKQGYCYSFTAWRYPDSFARQFRNCLAEFVDRELAIIAGGGNDTLPSQSSRRADAALSPAGRKARSWHRFIGDMAEAFLVGAIDEGRPAFMRLYVDGDINSVDNIFEWMNVCADLQRTRRDGANGRGAHPGIQVYGYSKVWDQFLLTDSLDVKWPAGVLASRSAVKLRIASKVVR